MPNWDDAVDDLIEIDKNSLREELLALTTEERVLIIEEYMEMVKSYGVGMKEYEAFIRFFDEILEEE